MLYIDGPYLPTRGVSPAGFEVRSPDNPGGLTDTHERSFNWDDVEDGIWERLGVPETERMF